MRHRFASTPGQSAGPRPPAVGRDSRQPHPKRWSAPATKILRGKGRPRWRPQRWRWREASGVEKVYSAKGGDSSPPVPTRLSTGMQHRRPRPFTSDDAINLDGSALGSRSSAAATSAGIADVSTPPWACEVTMNRRPSIGWIATFDPDIAKNRARRLIDGARSTPVAGPVGPQGGAGFHGRIELDLDRRTTFSGGRLVAE